MKAEYECTQDIGDCIGERTGERTGERPVDDEIVNWITTNFLPFEADLRGMLRRVCASEAEIDDVVQEVYYKVLTLPGVDHIQQPKWFLFRTARNIVIDRMRRDAVVRIDARSNLQDIDVADDAPSPERVALARAELRWVMGLIGSLPGRCRHVFRARRVYGMSQGDTAEMLKITERQVEYETTRGLQLISSMMKRVGVPAEESVPRRRASPRSTRKANADD